jgi:hypothetical protein
MAGVSRNGTMQSPLDVVLNASTTVQGSVPATSTGNVTLISSGAGAIYVYAFEIAAQSTANVGVRLVSGSTTASVWNLTLGATSTTAIAAGNVAEARGYVTPPAWIYRTAAGDPLTYEKGASSVAGALTSFSFSFWRQ